jgi:hypothetical protein
MKNQLTLGRFATVVGTSPRWVQNAFQALGLRPVYDDAVAKDLGLARVLQSTFGLPLVAAYPFAREALAGWPDARTWRKEGGTGSVALEVDVERYLSGYASRLALARTWYAERKRGRPSSRRKRGIAGASEYGIDIGLLEASLDRTPGERLRQLDDDLAFVRSLHVEQP